MRGFRSRGIRAMPPTERRRRGSAFPVQTSHEAVASCQSIRSEEQRIALVVTWLPRCAGARSHCSGIGGPIQQRGRSTIPVVPEDPWNHPRKDTPNTTSRREDRFREHRGDVLSRGRVGSYAYRFRPNATESRVRPHPELQVSRQRRRHRDRFALRGSLVAQGFHRQVWPESTLKTVSWHCKGSAMSGLWNDILPDRSR